MAGGIGVTPPIVAMADHAKAAGKDYEIHYCGRDVDTMALLDRLTAEHGAELEVHSSAAGNRLDIPALLATPVEGTQIYSCGPERLLTALEDATAHWPEDSLHVEHFTSNLATLDPADEHAFEVELRDSGLTVQVAADQTVLDASVRRTSTSRATARRGCADRAKPPPSSTARWITATWYSPKPNGLGTSR